LVSLSFQGFRRVGRDRMAVEGRYSREVRRAYRSARLVCSSPGLMCVVRMGRGVSCESRF
jgi:hypothetical protein